MFGSSLAFLFLALAPSTAQGVASATVRPASELPQGAVLEIDGVPISADEYGRWMLDLFASRQAQRFAEQYLVRGAARSRGVELPEGAVDARIDRDVGARIEGAFKGSREAWLDELRRTGWSEGGQREHQRTELEPRLLAEELTRRGRVVPEELVVRDWELFHGPSGKDYTLSGIRIEVAVEVPEGARKEEQEAARRRAFSQSLARALEVRERAVGGADFAALARECSDDPETRAQGGRISAAFRPPGWGAPFVESILALGPGAISMPLYAKGGYWVVKVEGVVETPLESVRAQLVQRLLELGPEDFEVAATWSAITDGLQVELRPELFAGPNSIELRDPVGLLINGAPVSRAEFATWLVRGRGEHYVRDFAEHWCVERRARELGLAVSEPEIEARMAEFQQRMIDQSYKGSREAWLAYMRGTGRDEAGWRQEWQRRFRIELLCEKILLAGRVVTDADVLARFQRSYGRDGRWVEARLLLVPLPGPSLAPGLSREELDRELALGRAAAQAQAERLRQRLEAGEDFATLAREHSGDTDSAARGGQLEGRFQPEQWPSHVGAAVMALEPGARSQVLDVERGFAVFEVTSARPVSFESVREALRRELETERPGQGDLAGLRNELVRKARIVTTPGVYGR